MKIPALQKNGGDALDPRHCSFSLCFFTIENSAALRAAVGRTVAAPGNLGHGGTNHPAGICQASNVSLSDHRFPSDDRLGHLDRLTVLRGHNIGTVNLSQEIDAGRS